MKSLATVEIGDSKRQSNGGGEITVDWRRDYGKIVI